MAPREEEACPCPGEGSQDRSARDVSWRSIWVMSQVQPSPVSDFAAAEGAQRERWLQCLLESVDKSSGSFLRPTVREFAADERRAGERIRERGLMPDPTSARVFVSYSRKDGAASAADLCEKLRKQDLSVWRDLVALKGGRDWWSQIEDAIRSKALQHFVLVVTPAALASSVVRREIRLARQEGKSVSPVKGPGLGDLGKVPRWFGNVYELDQGAVRRGDRDTPGRSRWTRNGSLTRRSPNRLGVTPEAAGSRENSSGWRRQDGKRRPGARLGRYRTPTARRPPGDRPVTVRSQTGRSGARDRPRSPRRDAQGRRRAA